jgi:hypothetical protein
MGLLLTFFEVLQQPLIHFQKKQSMVLVATLEDCAPETAPFLIFPPEWR